MKIDVMDINDIDSVIPLYIDYYNTCEDGCWMETTAKRRIKGLAIVKKTKNTFLARTLMKTVRDNIFGESIQFLISGGSAIPKVLSHR